MKYACKSHESRVCNKTRTPSQVQVLRSRNAQSPVLCSSLKNAFALKVFNYFVCINHTTKCNCTIRPPSPMYITPVNNKQCSKKAMSTMKKSYLSKPNTNYTRGFDLETPSKCYHLLYIFLRYHMFNHSKAATSSSNIPRCMQPIYGNDIYGYN